MPQFCLQSDRNFRLDLISSSLALAAQGAYLKTGRHGALRALAPPLCQEARRFRDLGAMG